MGDKNIDIQSVIEKSVSKTTIHDLQKTGVKKVKVIREKEINELIAKAVNAVIESRLAELATSIDIPERETLIAESKEEFKRLLQETQQAQKASMRIKKEEEKLKNEIKVLKRKVALQKEILDDEYQRGVEDGRKAQQGESNAEALLEDVARQTARAEQSEAAVKDLQSVSARIEQENAELRAKLETTEKFSRDLLEQESDKRRELEARCAKLQAQNDSLLIRNQEFEDRLRAFEKADAGRADSRQADAFRALQDKIESLAMAVGGGEAQSSDAKLESMMTTMTNKLTEQLSKQMVVAGDASSASKTGAEAVQNMEVMLDGLFKYGDLKSNVGAGEAKQRKSTGKGVGGSLAKLRALRGGGDKPEDDGVKKE